MRISKQSKARFDGNSHSHRPGFFLFFCSCHILYAVVYLAKKRSTVSGAPLETLAFAARVYFLLGDLSLVPPSSLDFFSLSETVL